MKPQYTNENNWKNNLTTLKQCTHKIKVIRIKNE